ncbi:MAG: hypothetical protein ABIR62_03460 [Dokdonella sp.]|uniref:hypothetical protein n=1 Tax=Dokdonella sp. TaxID=2291710 RepID=UPI0032644D30
MRTCPSVRRIVVLLALCFGMLARPSVAAIVIDLSYVDQQSAHFRSFKAFVDEALAGDADYGFSATDAAYMYRLTGNAAYALLAVQTADAQVLAAEAAIAAGDAPAIADDQYLHAGPMIQDIALVYDWCPTQTTVQQRARWSNYAEQAVWNIWNFNQAQWGGHPHAWPGWGTDDPANNYHYSFLSATMYWALASNSSTWTQLLQNQKWPEQQAYTATIAGGGSQEGSGYGLSHATLFALYRIWRDATGSDIGNANAHLRESVDWWIHATVPTLDRTAAIGDQARASEPLIYDYHRHLMLEALDVSNDVTAKAHASWWLHAIALQDMQSEFNERDNLMSAGPGGSPPADLVHVAPGTGQLFARTSWSTDAMWLQFAAGPFLQSHAHQDQGSFTLFEGSWLAVTENIWTQSGIQQGTETNNVVRFVHNGVTVPQREGTTSTMSVTTGANGNVHAVANLTPAFAGDPAIGSWQRSIDFADHVLTVSDAFALDAGTQAIFQVNTPVRPVVTDNTAIAGRLKVRVISPSTATLRVLDWTTMSNGDDTFHSGWRLDVEGGTTGYIVELSITDTVFSNGFD